MRFTKLGMLLGLIVAGLVLLALPLSMFPQAVSGGGNSGNGGIPTSPVSQNSGGTGINTVVSGLYRWWDSYGACTGAIGTGASDSLNQCSFSMAKRDIPGPSRNWSVAGTTFSQIQQSIFANIAQYENVVLPPKHEYGGGENDSVSCASASASCGVAMRLMRSADWLRLMTQYPSRVMPSTSACAKTGTWTNDTSNAVVPAGQTTLGYPVSNTTGTGTLTCTVPTSASSQVCLTTLNTTAATAVFTVSIDSSLVVDANSGTTSWSATTLSPTNPALTGAKALYGQCFAVTPNQTHQVVVTVSSGSGTEIGMISTVPPLAQQPYLAVYNVITDSVWTNAAVWNSITSSLITTFQGYGFGHIYLDDLVNGTPGMNTAADISSSEQAPLPGSTSPNHPGPIGQLHMYQTDVASAAAAGFRFSGTGMGGKSTELGVSSIPFRFYPYGHGQAQTFYEKFHLMGDSNFPSGVALYSGNNFLAGYATYTDASSGQPWSGKNILSAFSPAVNTLWNCTSTIPNNTALTTVVASSIFTTKLCDDPAGNAYRNIIVQTVGTAIASAATIAPTTGLVHVTGTAAISAVTPPPGVCDKGALGCTITLIPDGAWTLATGGTPSTTSFTFNNATTAVVGRPMALTCDVAAQRCYAPY